MSEKRRNWKLHRVTSRFIFVCWNIFFVDGSIQLRRHFFIIEDDYETFWCLHSALGADFFVLIWLFCYRQVREWVLKPFERIDNGNEVFRHQGKRQQTTRYDKSKFSVVQLAQHIAESETGILIVSDTRSFTRSLHLMLRLLAFHNDWMSEERILLDFTLKNSHFFLLKTMMRW